MNTLAMDRLLGYDVLDAQGNKIGSVDNLWIGDNQPTPEFVEVKSGFLGMKSFVIPATGAQVDDTRHAIQVPYDQSQIGGAPNLSSTSELTPEDEDRLYNYYGAGRTGMPAATGALEANTAPGAANAVNQNTYAANRANVAERDTINVPVVEEQLHVGKRAVEAGRVHLRKIVRTEHVVQPVELRHEEVTVERVPASGVAVPDQAFTEQTIDVPVMREEVVAEKQAVVTGQVQVHKTAETHTETVQGDVRKEEVVVDRADIPNQDLRRDQVGREDVAVDRTDTPGRVDQTTDSTRRSGV